MAVDYVNDNELDALLEQYIICRLCTKPIQPIGDELTDGMDIYSTVDDGCFLSQLIEDTIRIKVSSHMKVSLWSSILYGA